MLSMHRRNSFRTFSSPSMSVIDALVEEREGIIERKSKRVRERRRGKGGTKEGGKEGDSKERILLRVEERFEQEGYENERQKWRPWETEQQAHRRGTGMELSHD